MDVLDTRNASCSRNGLDSDYFNFLPVVAAAGGVGVAALLKKKKAKKYASSETTYLQNKYPAQSTSQAQSQAIESMKQERTQLEQERARVKSKASKNSIDARLKAFNEYINDSTNTLNELIALEKESASSTPSSVVSLPSEPTSTTTQLSPTQTAPSDSVLGTSSVGNEGATTQQVIPTLSGVQGLVSGVTPSASGSKTWMYLVGGLVLVGGFLLLRRKNA